jgi:hypothetical protein
MRWGRLVDLDQQLCRGGQREKQRAGEGRCEGTKNTHHKLIDLDAAAGSLP